MTTSGLNLASLARFRPTIQDNPQSRRSCQQRRSPERTPTKEGGVSLSPRDNASAPKPVEGALPNAENAIVDPRKIYDYSLNPEHAKGGPKAALLDQTLGFNRSNGEGLIEQIQRGVLENPVFDQTKTRVWHKV